MDPVAPRSEGFEHHPYAPQTDFLDTTVTNQARPLTQAVITVRVIKNFEYRAMKALVLKDVDLTTLTTPQLIAQCKEVVRTQQALKRIATWLISWIPSNYTRRPTAPRRRI